MTFDHWWNNVQKECEPRRATGRALAAEAWKAAVRETLATSLKYVNDMRTPEPPEVKRG